MQDSLFVDQHYNAARSDLLQQLHDLGPAGTTVVVNNRPMRLDSAIKLVEQFPKVSHFSWSGTNVHVEPNPFAWQRTSGQGPSGMDVVRRLMQSNGHQRAPWWQRWTRKLARTAA